VCTPENCGGQGKVGGDKLGGDETDLILVVRENSLVLECESSGGDLKRHRKIR